MKISIMNIRAKYYFGSLTFLAGIILSIIGIGYAAFIHLSRISNPFDIRLTYGLIGVGLFVTLAGLNTMIRGRVNFSNYLTAAGVALAAIGVFSFILSYPENWKYPNVTYIVATYACGICILVGNAFAKVILNLIEEKSTVKEEISEEEIEKAIDESLKRVLEFSETTFKFRDVSTEGFRPGKAFMFDRGKTVRVKDEVSEVEELKKIRGEKIRVKDESVEDATKLLKETIKKKEDKKFWR